MKWLQQPPWRLIDVRRVLGREHIYAAFARLHNLEKPQLASLLLALGADADGDADGDVTVPQVWTALSGCSLDFGDAAPTFARALDRAIQQQQQRVDANIQVRVAKKETADVDGSTQQGDVTHGGDSQSGEVPDGHSGGGGAPSDNNSPSEALGAAAGDDDATASAPQSGVRAGCDAQMAPPRSDCESDYRGNNTADSDDAGMLADPAGTARTDADTPSCDSSDAARVSDRVSVPDTAVVSGAGEAASPGTISPRPCYGGVHARVTAVRLKDRAARDVARSLRRILAVLDVGGQEDSPRIDGRRLARECVTRRFAISRAKRSEMQVGRVLLLADVSGSCSAAAAGTVSACAQVAAEMDNVTAIIHSNGQPIEMMVPGGEVIDLGGEDRSSFWARLLSEKIAGCVAFGDWDAGDIYEVIAGICPFIWLDSYASNNGIKPVPAKGWLRQHMDWRVPPVAWFQGVNDSVTAAIALRMAAKKGRLQWLQ